MAYSNRRWRVKRSGGKEESMNRVSGKRGTALRAGIGVLVLLTIGLPAMAKVEVDFNPKLDFPQFKHYTYIGGVEHLQVNVAATGNWGPYGPCRREE
jgi:hypothetical protein